MENYFRWGIKKYYYSSTPARKAMTRRSCGSLRLRRQVADPPVPCLAVSPAPARPCRALPYLIDH